MKNLLQAYMMANLKPAIKKRFEKLSNDTFINQADELIRGDDFFNNVWKVDEEKKEIMDMCKEVENQKPIDTERFAELRFNRMLLLEELLIGGYDSVSDSKINARMDSVWNIINKRI